MNGAHVEAALRAAIEYVELCKDYHPSAQKRYAKECIDCIWAAQAASLSYDARSQLTQDGDVWSMQEL